jgi:hypothetical protein
LEKAVRDDGGADARAVLTRAGFRRGFQRLWVAQGSDDENILFLYEFRDGVGAREYFAHSHATLSTDPKRPSPVPFDVPGIPGAFGLRVQDSTGSSAFIDFTVGRYVAQAVVNGNAATNQSQAAITLAMAEYTRVSSSQSA